MDISFSSKKYKTHLLFAYIKNKKIEICNKECTLQLKTLLKNFTFQAEKEELLACNSNDEKFIVVGISKKASFEEIRNASSLLFTKLKSLKEEKANFIIPFQDKKEIKAALEGFILTSYSFNKYKSDEKKARFEISIKKKNIDSLLKETLIECKNIFYARSLANENADIITPEFFEKEAKKFTKQNKLKIKVLGEKQISKEKLGLLKAVGQGSTFPPRLIVVEYNGKPNSKEKIALVGKGITFDTGGLNLKPTGYIEDMKTDMAGAATVFSAFRTAVELKVKKNIILVLSCAENAISAKAYKPGDIFTSYNKISVEITNTDAEGRLVLADALSYVQKHYKPTQIIDMATLTGACMVALGTTTIGMFGNDNTMKNKLKEASQSTSEKVWSLPIFDEHRDALKSEHADTLNSDPKRYGGASTAAAFLEKFIEKDVKWTHLDIAGPAWSKNGAKYYIPSKGTGTGVRLIVDYLKQ